MSVPLPLFRSGDTACFEWAVPHVLFGRKLYAEVRGGPLVVCRLFAFPGLAVRVGVLR